MDEKNAAIDSVNYNKKSAKWKKRLIMIKEIRRVDKEKRRRKLNWLIIDAEHTTGQSRPDKLVRPLDSLSAATWDGIDKFIYLTIHCRWGGKWINCRRKRISEGNVSP